MILSQVVGKLLGSGPLCDSECHHVQYCTSTQRVVDPRWPCPDRPRQISDSTSSEKSTGRSLFRRRKRHMTTIYIDSRKRVAGDDSSFEFDIGETLHLQTGAKLSVLKFRVADAFLSTDRGQYLFWIDEALQTLNWAVLPVGAYTGSRLAAWISSNFGAASYDPSTNQIDVANDDAEIRSLFPGTGSYPAGATQPPAQHQPPPGAQLHRRSAANLRVRHDESVLRIAAALQHARHRRRHQGAFG
eukprot:s8498_g4.t1